MGAPKLDQDKILAHLEVLDRDPFRLELGKLLECAPDEDTLKKFAATHPDKWSRAVATLATLSGYQEKTETQTNIYTQINVMSDSQLNAELQQVLAELGKSNLIDGS